MLYFFMVSLSQIQALYGPQPIYGTPPGVLPSPLSSLLALLSAITAPFIVVVSFIVGIILYLSTHKKVFIIIPLILSVLYLIRRLIEIVFGI